jgi:hypothetical protein
MAGSFVLTDPSPRRCTTLIRAVCPDESPQEKLSTMISPWCPDCAFARPAARATNPISKTITPWRITWCFIEAPFSVIYEDVVYLALFIHTQHQRLLRGFKDRPTTSVSFSRKWDLFDAP